MRSRFPGYFRLSPARYKKLWQEAFVSVDANVMLDLYRYSDDTRKELLKLLTKLRDRLWVANHAAYEFLENRLNVIGDSINAYAQSIVKLNQLEEDFKASRGHPFLEGKTANQFFRLADKVRTEFDRKKAEWERRVNHDEIVIEVHKLLDGRVGEEFPDQRLAEICAEGKKRFEAKIPPGFADSKKPEGTGRYGDLIIWTQLIQHSKSVKKPLILVTADAKEDWWRIFRGKALGARPELTAEMLREAGQNLLLYSLDGFMNAAEKELSQTVKTEAVEEVKEVRHRKADVATGLATSNFERGFATGLGAQTQLSAESIASAAGAIPEALRTWRAQDLASLSGAIPEALKTWKAQDITSLAGTIPAKLSDPGVAKVSHPKKKRFSKR
jgi:hypothetical protein